MGKGSERSSESDDCHEVCKGSRGGTITIIQPMNQGPINPFQPFYNKYDINLSSSESRSSNSETSKKKKSGKKRKTQVKAVGEPIMPTTLPFMTTTLPPPPFISPNFYKKPDPASLLAKEIEELNFSLKKTSHPLDEMKWNALRCKFGIKDIPSALMFEHRARLKKISKKCGDLNSYRDLQALDALVRALHNKVKYNEAVKNLALAILRKKEAEDIVQNVKDRCELDSEDSDPNFQLMKDRIRKLRKTFRRTNKMEKPSDVREDEIKQLLIETLKENMHSILTNVRLIEIDQTGNIFKKRIDLAKDPALLRQLEVMKAKNPDAKELVIQTNPVTNQFEIVVK
ncbi:hypothetical protein HELRODRAFT_181805 [Helobdella robusta]|uniref:Uncharacterized protein n=1 Tax=Helobdella robusta TaxID=6412 RepID=T1FHC5_HELRO|nr:hypothetical protein HELRODRAFT_181805 [Helobdella robusta]ESN92029.1 hypothetical protein HELRODRAFT_181805 [Helobdella robusta]